MTADFSARDPFRALQDATRTHRREHGCGAYTFEDGAGLIDLCARFKPARILELGAALGYTACCLASGSPNAHVVTIERDFVHVELARRNIEEAKLSHRITVFAGSFSEVLPTLSSKFDFVFFDGFAPDVAVLKSLEALLTPEGVLVCANLSLAAPAEARRMLSMLGDREAWRPLPAIEAGATAVWRKR
jgi:predicted O-methyltransferase YrrM